MHLGQVSHAGGRIRGASWPCLRARRRSQAHQQFLGTPYKIRYSGSVARSKKNQVKKVAHQSISTPSSLYFVTNAAMLLAKVVRLEEVLTALENRFESVQPPILMMTFVFLAWAKPTRLVRIPGPE